MTLPNIPWGWVLCPVRYLRPDHNPLRRRLDRVHALLVIGLVVAFLVGAPLAIALTAHASYQGGLRAARQEAVTRRPADAVVLRVGQPGTPFVATPQIVIRWRTPAGAARTGYVTRGGDVRPGSHLRIWIDRAGDRTDPPPGHGQIVGTAVVTSVTALSVFTLVVFLGYLFAEHALERRRLAMWDREWRTVAPHWTSGR